jgi:hypothetical protein
LNPREDSEFAEALRAMDADYQFPARGTSDEWRWESADDWATLWRLYPRGTAFNLMHGKRFAA